MPDPTEKTCAACGRTFAWRKKWARNWAEIRWCSDACRRLRVRDVDAELERAILSLLDDRNGDASICPSEAARAVAEDWRSLMERARSAARRLVARGLVEITQRGAVVDPSAAKGPIRVRRASAVRRRGGTRRSG